MRTCLVTGAGRGIGASVATMLSREGHRVALLGRNVEALDAVGRELSGPVLSIGADVTDRTQLEAAFGRVEAEWGSVDVLVSNAGAGAYGRIVDISDQDWAHLMDLNLTAPFRLVRRALPGMVDQGWGRIVIVASVVAKRGEAELAAYTASKHGVLGLVRAAAAEVARTGVTVNAVCPGYVDTPMTDATIAAAAARTGRSTDDIRGALARRQPIGRLIEPDEVAEAVRFCVVNGAVNGQGINVDGGTVQS